MNHHYKVVFNRSLNLWQAVSELARSRGKASRGGRAARVVGGGGVAGDGITASAEAGADGPGGDGLHYGSAGAGAGVAIAVASILGAGAASLAPVTAQAAAYTVNNGQTFIGGEAGAQ
jgi:hypothetical protein